MILFFKLLHLLLQISCFAVNVDMKLHRQNTWIINRPNLLTDNEMRPSWELIMFLFNYLLIHQVNLFIYKHTYDYSKARQLGQKMISTWNIVSL